MHPIRFRAFLMIGCAAAALGVTAAGQSSSNQPPAVDVSARATVPFEQLTPVITPARSAEGPRPLSERAAKQVVLARELADEQRLTEAALELEKALRYDPNHPEIHRSLALVHWRAGNTAQAARYAGLALSANGDDATAHYVAGRCALSQGDRAAGLTSLRTAMWCGDFGKDVELAALTRYHVAEALAAEGYFEAALSQYRSFDEAVRGLTPAASSELSALLKSIHGSAGEARSIALERLGRFAEAAATLEEANGAAPPDRARLIRLARLLLKANRTDDALRIARSMQVDDAESLALLVEIYQQAGKLDQAVEELRGRLGQADARITLLVVDVLIKLNRVRDASDELRAFLSRAPGAFDVRVKLVDLLLRQERWLDAVEAAAEGLKEQPAGAEQIESLLVALKDNRAALDELRESTLAGADPIRDYLVATALDAGGRADEADKLLQRSWTAAPEFVPMRVALARRHLRGLRYDDALHVARRSEANTVEDARLELVLGEVHERLDDAKTAEAHFRAALDADRNNLAAMFALAQLSRRAGDVLQTQQRLRTLLKQSPTHEAARELLAFTLLERGEGEAFLQELEELTKTAASPGATARARALLEQVKSQNPAAYRESLIQSMNTSGQDAATWLAVAESYTHSESAEAKDAFLRALAVDPTNEPAKVGLKEVQRRLIDFEGAIERLDELLRWRPNRHAWRFEKVELLLAVDRIDEALAILEDYAKRADLDPRTRRSYQITRVSTLDGLGRKTEAEAYLQSLAESEDDKAFWSAQLARILEEHERYADALALYEKTHRNDPSNVAAQRDFLFASAEHGDAVSAIQTVLDMINDDPESEPALSLLIRVLALAKRHDEAVEMVRNRLMRTPEREAYQDLWISLHLQAKQVDAAMDLAERLMNQALDAERELREPPAKRTASTRFDSEILQLRPNDTSDPDQLSHRVLSLRRRLGALMVDARRYRDADHSLNEWVRTARDMDAQYAFMVLLASLYQRQGGEDASQQWLERALMLNPDNPTLYNDVAYGWINRGVRLLEADRLIRAALAREPRAAAFLDTYGWLQYKKGDFAAARKWLTRAVTNSEKPDGVIHDHLGDVVWQLGERQQAITLWRRAVELTAVKPGDTESPNSDERRVREQTPKKIADAESGATPNVAPIAPAP